MKPEILIVEDDLIIGQAVARDLEAHGYTVAAICESGEDALLVIEKNLPDLVLMDIKLQGKLDGIQVTERILKKYRVPIIYLTDMQDSITLNKARQSKPTNYLIKPFQTHQLLIAVDLAIFNGASTVTGERFGFFKEGTELIKIVYDDILYLKAEGSYCDVVTTQKSFTLTMPMNKMLQRIPYPDLIRVSRSYSVNKNHVERIMGKLITIRGVKIAVGETYSDVIRENFNVI